MSEQRLGRASTLAALLRYNAAHFGDTRRAAPRRPRAHVPRSSRAQVDDTMQVLGRHVAPGDRVALWFNNSFNWLASFIAINALGAVSVPINTRLTAAELEVILRDVRARALVTVPHYRGRNYLDEALRRARALPEGMLVLDASDERPAARVADRRRAHGRGRRADRRVDDLLCIQYTSGTTALPKGAMLTNRRVPRRPPRTSRAASA